MKIKNKKNKSNYLNFRDNGVPKRILIQAGRVVKVHGLSNINQVINSGDFKRGFFEVVEEAKAVEPAPKKESKKKASKKKTTKKKSKKKDEDFLDKVEKEVRDYTDNEE